MMLWQYVLGSIGVAILLGWFTFEWFSLVLGEDDED